ncbi:MAG: ABC transporter permease [Chitinispirillaceae bacterium]|nr:ABC transporter permease [Chitinispirillaceae bacterium]
MLIALSWKNIWRHPLRSGVVIVSIALGLCCGIFSTAFMNGMGRQTIHDAVSRELANIQLHDPLFVEEPLPSRVIPGADSIFSALRAVASVKAAAARTRVTAMVASAKTGAGVTVKGIEPAQERLISRLPGDIVKGTWFDGARRNPVVIGSKLAQKLDAKLKTRIVLTTQTIEGDLTGGAFKVVGIFRTSNSTFDENTVFVIRSDLSRLIGAQGDAIHEIAVLLRHDGSTDSVAAALRGAYPALSVQTWKEIQPEVGMMESLMRQMMYLFVVVILFALSFGIVNTMIMAVLERRREFGMLMAVGMSNGSIFSMVMIETVLLSAAGGGIGMLLGEVAIAATAKTGINLSSLARGLTAMGYSPLVYPYIDVGFFVGLSIMVVVTGIAASIYPAVKALGLNPADAVRSET